MGYGLKLWIPVIVVAIFSISIISISAEESQIPSWIKNTVSFWVSGDVSDNEFISAIEWMLENDVIEVSSSDDEWKAESDKLFRENEQLRGDIKVLEDDILRLTKENQRLEQENDYLYYQNTEPSYETSTPEPEIDYTEHCFGSASCFVGTVTSIIDGDTIRVDGNSIRFALVDTPEKKQPGFEEARDFIEEICPVGSTVLVDEDDEQTQGSYDRMVAVVYCHDTSLNLNESLLYYGHGWITIQYCSNSEFGTHSWALDYGCADSYYSPPSYEQPKYTPPSSQTTQPSCDPHYPTVCIPTYPPDLDCGEISYANFEVLQPDPHGFDGDKDGIGCES